MRAAVEFSDSDTHADIHMAHNFSTHSQAKKLLSHGAPVLALSFANQNVSFVAFSPCLLGNVLKKADTSLPLQIICISDMSLCQKRLCSSISFMGSLTYLHSHSLTHTLTNSQPSGSRSELPNGSCQGDRH